MENHYVCTGGCGGVSPTEGTCQAESCALHNQPLKQCSCTDNAHAGVMASAAEAQVGGEDASV